jgi:catechol 2,3-dioxygenase-like lactoylglutathione lyase family enzyme
VDWKLELIAIPVTDVDRAIAFYRDSAGFTLDHDHRVSDEMRFVQLTPPGSGWSITIGKGPASMEPGAIKGLQLVVADVEAARRELAGRGVEVSEVRHVEQSTGQWGPGHGGPWNAFVFFEDPDGNAWAIQEKPAAQGRGGGRRASARRPPHVFGQYS